MDRVECEGLPRRRLGLEELVWGRAYGTFATAVQGPLEFTWYLEPRAEDRLVLVARVSNTGD